MKKLFLFSFCVAAVAAFADTPCVSNVAARQRWPFSPVVDIDFWLESEECQDVVLSASYDGGQTTIALEGDAVGGSLFGLAPGMNHVTWDPVKAGFGDRQLKDFKVSAAVADKSARTYLVLDLADGSSTFAAQPPDDTGWTNSAYRSGKMVFRRIPAGRYELGYTDAEITYMMQYLAYDYMKVLATYQKAVGRRTVVITHDFYLAIFSLTGQQYGYAASGAGSGGETPIAKNVSVWRGSATDDGINWPVTGHAVSKTSFLGRMRDRMHLPSGMILDLPTEAQWEIAARAGTTTLFPNGGTIDNTKDELFAILDRIAWRGEPPKGYTVGMKEPNAWGLYDVLGLEYEGVLNAYCCSDTSKNLLDCAGFTVGWRETSPSVDPVGPSCVADGTLFRLSCNVGWAAGLSPAANTSARRAYSYSTTVNTATRLCIHLQPLVNK